MRYMCYTNKTTNFCIIDAVLHQPSDDSVSSDPTSGLKNWHYKDAQTKRDKRTMQIYVARLNIVIRIKCAYWMRYC